jgi:hypothetical protein
MPGCSRAVQFWPTLGDSCSRRYRAVVWHNAGLVRKRGCLLEVRGACALGNEREKWAAHTWACLRDETGQKRGCGSGCRGGEKEREAQRQAPRERGALRGTCAARAHHTRQRARAQGAQGAHSGSAQGAQHRSAQGAQHRERITGSAEYLPSMAGARRLSPQNFCV